MAKRDKCYTAHGCRTITASVGEYLAGAAATTAALEIYKNNAFFI